MCGIVGCIGLPDPRKYIIEGLKTLDYRGYDSAGAAFLNSNIEIFKEVGTIDKLNAIIPLKQNGRVAIGHTRWATHGKPSVINSHPHLSFKGQFAIVHNGFVGVRVHIPEIPEYRVCPDTHLPQSVQCFAPPGRV